MILTVGIGIGVVASATALAQGTGTGNSRPTTPPSTTTTPSTAAKPLPKPSMRELLKKGYTIVSVTVLGPEFQTAIGNDPKNPQILVSMQKDRRLAACQYASANWINLATVSIEGTTQCEVYPK